MGNQWRLAVVLAIAAVVIVGLSAATHAQGSVPVECENPLYDFNGDRTVTRADINGWRLLAKQTGCDPRGSKPDPNGCSPRLDLNGDGMVDKADIMEIVDVYRICARGSIDPPRR